MCLLLAAQACDGPAKKIWHTINLAEEFTADLPGMNSMAWLNLLPEFDPYKYNSFATNAADVVHRLTTRVDIRIASRVRANNSFVLPPTLVFKSVVDDTGIKTFGRPELACI